MTEKGYDRQLSESSANQRFGNHISACLTALRTMTAIAKHVKLLVGGLRYTLAASDLKKHPESIFSSILEKTWKTNGDVPAKIDRDGDVFKYVNAFLVNGNLPRKSDGVIALEPEELNALKEEAKFYNLPKLLEECNKSNDVFEQIAVHGTVRSYIETVRSFFIFGRDADIAIPTLHCRYASSDPTDLVNVLASARSPFCTTGNVPDWRTFDDPIFKSSTPDSPNVAELLDHAMPPAPGKDMVSGTAAAEHLEISAENLNAETLEDFGYSTFLRTKAAGFYASARMKLRPRKLVIHQQGGHFDQHRDTVRGDNHIGTLVVILNSAYTGGELEISHGGKTEVVTGPYKWVAMYGDCLHKINPVTSGTRVSLIYDIHTIPESEEEEAVEEEDDVVRREEDKLSNLLQTLDSAREVYVPGKDRPRDIDQVQANQICAALDKELDTYGTVVICLAHLYPACQSNPSFLKGGDLALYELLSDKYQVSVEAVSVFTSQDYYWRGNNHLGAAVMTDVVSALEKSKTSKAQTNKIAAKTGPQPLFVIPQVIPAECIVDHSHYVECHCNGNQNGETVYIVSGLQVRKL